MESSQNNQSQSPTLLFKSPIVTTAFSLEPSNEKKPDDNDIISNQSSTDSSHLLENLHADPSTRIEKEVSLLSQVYENKTTSSFPADLSVNDQANKKLSSPQPQPSFETDSELCNSSSGYLYSQSSQDNTDVPNDNANPDQKKTIQSVLTKVLESENNKEIELPSDLLSGITLRKFQSEIPTKTEPLPNLELGQIQAQSVRSYAAEEEKRPSPFNRSPRETSRIPLEKLKKVVPLGAGSFAKVYLMKDMSSSKLFAVKRIEKQHLKRNHKEHQMFVEREVLKRLNKTNRPTFSRFYGSQEDDEYLHLILEYVNGGEFAEYLKSRKSLSKDQVRQFSAELIDILESIHSCGIIHRDLKPENLLLTDTGHLKCIDFGGAKILNDVNMPQAYVPSNDDIEFDRLPRQTFIGTIFYVSPEMLEERECGYAVDLWALGCIIYKMATGNVPFNDKVEFKIYEKIKNAEVQYPESMDPEIKDLVQRLLIKEPHFRLGAGPKGSENSFAALKSHPFFKIFHTQKIDFKQINLKIPPENELILAHIREQKENFEAKKTKYKDQGKQKAQALSSSIRLNNEDIILSGCVMKDCGFFKPPQRRNLILSNERLEYYHPEKNTILGQIPLSNILEVAINPKHKSMFFIQIETRKYSFKQIEQEYPAEKWVQTIIESIKQLD